MSEIARCPHCGEEPDILIDLFDKHGKYPKGYSCCGAEFVELDRWNKYAAAMELAKAKHQRESIRRNVFGDWDEYDENLLQAERRVLEIFK